MSANSLEMGQRLRDDPLWLVIQHAQVALCFELPARGQRSIVVGSASIADVRVECLAPVACHLERDGDFVRVAPGHVEADLRVDSRPVREVGWISDQGVLEISGQRLFLKVHPTRPAMPFGSRPPGESQSRRSVTVMDSGPNATELAPHGHIDELRHRVTEVIPGCGAVKPRGSEPLPMAQVGAGGTQLLEAVRLPIQPTAIVDVVSSTSVSRTSEPATMLFAAAAPAAPLHLTEAHLASSKSGFVADAIDASQRSGGGTGNESRSGRAEVSPRANVEVGEREPRRGGGKVAPIPNVASGGELRSGRAEGSFRVATGEQGDTVAPGEAEVALRVHAEGEREPKMRGRGVAGGFEVRVPAVQRPLASAFGGPMTTAVEVPVMRVNPSSERVKVPLALRAAERAATPSVSLVTKLGVFTRRRPIAAFGAVGVGSLFVAVFLVGVVQVLGLRRPPTSAVVSPKPQMANSAGSRGSDAPPSVTSSAAVSNGAAPRVADPARKDEPSDSRALGLQVEPDRIGSKTPDAASARIDEQLPVAAGHLFAGRLAEAGHAYRELAARHPNERTYETIATLLERRSRRECRSGHDARFTCPLVKP